MDHGRLASADEPADDRARPDRLGLDRAGASPFAGGLVHAGDTAQAPAGSLRVLDVNDRLRHGESPLPVDEPPGGAWGGVPDRADRAAPPGGSICDGKHTINI